MESRLVQQTLDAIRGIMFKNNENFMSYAWRNHIENALKCEDKYLKLANWIDAEVYQCFIIINAYNPADKENDYTTHQFKEWQKACMEMAMLTNLKVIMLDSYCTLEMRENIEYTICKYFKIKFNEELGEYVWDK